MRASLKRLLAPARWRLRRKRIARAATAGGLYGSIAAFLLAISLWFLPLDQLLALFGAPSQGRWPLMSTLLLLPSVGSLCAGLAAAARRPSWAAVAQRVDAHFELLDRTSTAWFFATSPRSITSLQQLQIDDAMEHLTRVRLDEFQPLIRGRQLYGAAAMWLAALVVATVPLSRHAAEAARTAAQQATEDRVRVKTATELEQSLLEELRQLAEMTGTKAPELRSLQRLADDVEQRLQELKQAGGDRRETLETLSKIEASLSDAQANLDPAAMHASLNELGKVLSSAESLATLSQSIQQQDYEAAAAQLHDLDVEALSEVERETLADAMKPLAEQFEARGQQEIAESVNELQDGLAQSDSQQVAGAAARLAEQFEQQIQRMLIQQSLDNQLAQMAEAKGESLSGGDNTDPSDEARETWGGGKAGKPLAETSEALASDRQREQLTGQQGDGPTHREMSPTDTLTGEAERDYQVRARRTATEVEQALRHESLPLGHRRTIRHYFRQLRDGE